MLKEFTKEARLECGLDDLVKGKRWAFIATTGTPTLHMTTSAPNTLGVAVEGESGYYPVPWPYCHSDSWDEMHDHAVDLNRAEGLDDKEAMAIVMSSMRAQNTA